MLKEFGIIMTGVIVIMVAVMGVFIAGGVAGMGAGYQKAQREAIEAGAGHWTINPETGEKSFQWTGQTK